MLLVSGGHCQFLAVEGPDRFRRLGGTIDDAPGEAFDKVAKLLGLDPPGGPAVEAAALGGDPARFALPRPLLDREGCDLSFSGLKTAVRRVRDRLVEAQGGITRADRADLCAGFQAAVAETLAEKTRRACRVFRAGHPDIPQVLAVAGGVAANASIRACALRGRRRRRGPRSWRRRWRSAPTTARSSPGRRPSAWRSRGRTTSTLPARPRWPLDAEAAPMLGAGPQGGQGVIAVLGAGAFGTALAVARGHRGPRGRLWGRDPEAMATAERARDGCPAARRAAAAEHCAAHRTLRRSSAAEALLLAVPAQATEAFLADAAGVRCRRRRWCSAPRGSTRARTGGRARSPPRGRRDGRWRR